MQKCCVFKFAYAITGTSPVTYGNIKQGRYTVTVRANCPDDNNRTTRQFRFRARN